MREDPRAKVFRLDPTSLYQKWISVAFQGFELFNFAEGLKAHSCFLCSLMAAVKCGVNNADYIEAVQHISCSLKHAMPSSSPTVVLPRLPAAPSSTILSRTSILGTCIARLTKHEKKEQ